MRVDISVDRSFQSYQNPDNFKSWRSCSFQSYQKSGRLYASCQISELTKKLFRANKILSTVGVDISANRSFQSYQNPDNFKGWRSCSLKPVNYEGWERSFSELPKSWQQCELTFLSIVVFRATIIPTTLRVDVSVTFRAIKNLEDTMLSVNYRSWQRTFSKLQKSCQQ